MTPLLCAQDADDNGESEDAQAPNAVAQVEADGEGEGDDEEAAAAAAAAPAAAAAAAPADAAAVAEGGATGGDVATITGIVPCYALSDAQSAVPSSASALTLQVKCAKYKEMAKQLGGDVSNDDEPEVRAAHRTGPVALGALPARLRPRVLE